MLAALTIWASDFGSKKYKPYPTTIQNNSAQIASRVVLAFACRCNASFVTSSSTDITVNADISVTAWVPYVVGTWPIGIFELSAKAGYAFWDADFKASASGVPSEKGNDSGEDFAYGVGAGVNFLEHFNAKLEYEVMDVSDADVTAWWITCAWRF